MKLKPWTTEHGFRGGGETPEKTIVATNKVDISLKRINEKEQMPTMERGRDRIVKNLNEKLASVLLDIHAKDDLATKNVKMAPVADAGREMAEADHAITLKKELDEALRQGKLANEKLYNSEAALKECMQQLNFVRDKQERRIRDTVAKTSREFEKAQEALQDKLTDANRRLEELTLENSRLSKALLVKEKLIEDKQKLKSQSEVEFSSLMDRLDLIEKENAFLKYEFHVLEKEIEIRNEEMEYTRQSSDLAHKQHLQDVKKIAKLEVECQKLRLLLQKRLPGPAAMVKMKNEVEMLGKDKSEVRRRKPNPTRDLIVRGSTAENPPENPTKRINLLLEQLHNVEENKTLREIMTKKDAQIQSLCSMCSQTSSRPTTELKSRPKELFKGQKSMELIRNSPLSSELSVTSSFDIGSIVGNSSSCSWANALFSESAQLYKRLGNPIDPKAITVPDMRLMDDFLEMEKLALSDGKELVPFEQGHCGFSNTKQIQSKDVAGERYFDWLQIVLKAISEHKRISSRSLVEILEDIKIALGCGNLLNTPDVNKNECSMPPIEANAHHISSYIGWKSPNVSPSTGSLGRASSVDTSAEKTKDQQFQPSLSKSIGKIIKLIEGIGPTSSNSSKTCQEKNQTPKQSPTQADYFVCVFQWKSSELSTILQRFHRTCNDLLNKRADLETFAEELSFALDWIVNFCVTPKEASSARDKIKRHFGWNDSQSEIEVASASHTSAVEPDVTHTSKEQSSDSFASSPDQNRSVIPEKEGIICSLEEENRSSEDDLKDMKTRLESATNKSKTLMVQLEETKESIGRLQAELNMLKESKEMVEDQLENQKSINEYLDTQLIVAKAKLNEIFQKCSSLEVELEFKNNSCEELEATCLELQLQLESVAKKETLKFAMNREGKQSQKGREITAVSVKLAECQETILNLGKQLKVLASPQDAVLFDKVFSNSSTAAINRRVNKRLSLHDRMLVDDGGKATDIVMSPKIQEAEDSTLSDSNNCKKLQASGLLLDTSEAHCGSSRESTNAGVMALAIVPSKKQGVGLLRRLLFRRRKGYSKKPHYQN